MKKTLKILGITLLFLIIALFLIPILFKGNIEKMVKKAANDNINGQVEWTALDLSLFRNFPSVSLSLKDISLINTAPFEGDTLVYAKDFSVSMGLMQLFKDEGLSIDQLYLDKAFINVKVNSDGTANYDIAKSKDSNESSQDTTTPGNDTFQLHLNHYEITSSK